MTEQEEQQLQELGRDLAQALQSPWEPRCIAHAFARRGPEALRFTMQSWADLELARSPLLQGELPGTIEDLELALRACGWHAPIAVNPEEAVGLAVRLRELITEAFGMALEMQPKEPQSGAGNDGFGTWLPMWCFLVVQAGLSPADALSLEVRHAFPLMAGTRANQGWQVAGVPYALRDVSKPVTAPDQ